MLNVICECCNEQSAERILILTEMDGTLLCEAKYCLDCLQGEITLNKNADDILL